MNTLLRIDIMIMLTGLIVLSGCRHAGINSGQTNTQGLPVTVTQVHTGKMLNYLELNATSVFLFKAAIKAPIAGYIENMFINQGEAVDKDHLLFTIRTKESAAITGDSLNILKFKGIVNVKAAAAGLISSIEHPKGDYVTEGDQLCQVAIPESFVFILDVPFELSGFVKTNTPCEIMLPDSTKLKGIIKSPFTSMDVNSQTERFIVKLQEPKGLPENLTVRIKIVKESENDATSLPKSCILTDETMQQFWVMKLINDTTAVKVPVSIGISDGGYIQIIKPFFKSSDLFLTSGNFGLGDTAYVKVLNFSHHE